MESLTELLEHELKDIYNAEHQLLKALPRMAKKASSPTLKDAFTSHTKETEVQIDRQRMLHDEVLSFVNLATPGKMLVFDYKDNGARVPANTGGGPAGYSFCAEEAGTCNFNGN